MTTIKIEIVRGRGSLVASRNGSVVATVNPGDGLVSVNYNVGDTFHFQAYPDTTLGFQFDKFCADTNCATSTTVNPFSGTVSQDGYLGVYFLGTPATVTVTVQNGVGGKVDVYRNTKFVSSVTTSQVISFFINDIFTFTAVPLSGYSFSKYCTDASCTQSTTGNPFTGIITQPSGNLYALFKSGGGLLAGCDPTTCPTDKNFCISGNCVPKSYLLIGVAGFFMLTMMN